MSTSVDVANRVASEAVDCTVDADLHVVVPSTDVLLPYLPDYWVEQLEQTGFSGATANAHPPPLPTSVRPDLRSLADNGPAGSDLAMLREHALDAWGVDYGIINCSYAVDTIRNPYAAAAITSAVNDWLIAEWLDAEPRLRASIVVPSHVPDLAVSEIERVGDHPGFVQVYLPARSAAPYGRRDYHKVLAAAVERDLVVSLQFGGFPGNPPTPVGWPSYVIEEYVGMACIMQSQVLNLVSEGVFDLFKDLRIAVVECGFTWLPSLMWRFDKDWKGLRRQVPWLRRPPSEYIREHMRFTTQPLDVPHDRPETLADIIEQMWGDELLMFSTDYPHWQFDSPQEAFPVALEPEAMQRIMGGNAKQLYRLG